MATLEEINAEIARRQGGGGHSLDAINAEIAKRQQTEQPKQSYFERSKARHDKVMPMIKEAFQGDAEFRGEGVTNYEDWSAGQKNFGFNVPDIKTTFAGMFGTDEDKSISFFKNHPQFEKKTDKSGNDYFIDQGKKVYIDDPALDLGDVGDLAGQAGSYMVGGALAAPVKNVLARTAVNNPLTRSAVTSASMYGTDVANQLMAGRDEIDQGQAGTAAALGGVVEFASPYVGKVFHWAKNKLSGNSRLIKDGAKLAKANNMKLDDDDLETLGRIRNTLDKSVPDEAIIAEYKHGLKLTRGQATKNQAQMSEEQLLSKDPDYMNKFKSVEDYNKRQVEQNLRKMRSKMHGQTDDVLDPTVSAQTSQGALHKAEQTAKKAYQDEFEKVGALTVNKKAVDTLQSSVGEKLRTNNIRLHKRNTPKANEAIEILQEEMVNPAKHITLDDYKQTRGFIGNLYSNNMDGTDKRALTIIKNQYDDWFYNSVDDTLLSGNKESVDQLLKARAMMTDYSKKFNSKDNVNKVIRTIIKEEKTPEEFSQMLVGVNGTNKAGAGNLVKAYKNAVGVDSEGFNALRAHVFEKMMLSNAMKPDGSMALKGYKGLMNSFGKGKTMMKELYTRKEFAEMSSLMRSVGQIVKEEGLANPSGSGFVMARVQALMNRIPFYTSIKNAGKYSKSQTMPKAMSQVDMPIPEILGVTQAANQQNH